MPTSLLRLNIGHNVPHFRPFNAVKSPAFLSTSNKYVKYYHSSNTQHHRYGYNSWSNYNGMNLNSLITNKSNVKFFNIRKLLYHNNSNSYSSGNRRSSSSRINNNRIFCQNGRHQSYFSNGVMLTYITQYNQYSTNRFMGMNIKNNSSSSSSSSSSSFSSPLYPFYFSYPGVIRYFSSRIDTSKDYYAMLGIAKSASSKEVRSAYVKLAKEWHPDVHATKSEADKDKAKKKFQEIQEAYEILSDDSMRKKYDEMRRLGTRFHYPNMSEYERYNTSYSRSRMREDWERQFRQQMQAEWERIRAQQQARHGGVGGDGTGRGGGGDGGYYHDSSRNPFDPFFQNNRGFGGLPSFFQIFITIFIITTIFRLIGQVLFGPRRYYEDPWVRMPPDYDPYRRDNPWEEWKRHGPYPPPSPPRNSYPRDDRDRNNNDNNRQSRYQPPQPTYTPIDHKPTPRGRPSSDILDEDSFTPSYGGGKPSKNTEDERYVRDLRKEAEKRNMDNSISWDEPKKRNPNINDDE